MTTLFVDKAGCDLDVEAGRIVMRENGERAGTWPLGLVERLVVNRGSRVSGRLAAALSRAGIGLMVDGGRSGDAPAMMAPAAADRGLRLAQYALASDERLRAPLAAALVAARLDGAIALVAARAKDDPRLARLRGAQASLAPPRPAPPIAVLRGIEGAGVAAFFEAYGALVPAPFAFAGRNRRPPRDPVNVCLSLGYSLAHFEAVRLAALNGLDPAIGFYHEPFPGRASLACDLVEPVRPHVENWVLELLASGGVGAGEFSSSGGGCVLSKPGRRFVYRHHEEIAAEAIRRKLEAGIAAFVAGLRAAPPPGLPAAGGAAHAPDY